MDVRTTPVAGRYLDDRDDIGRVPLEELDRRVRAAGEVWEALLDECVSAGMLPSQPVASLLSTFLERDYWIAEEARIEGLRRRTLSDRTRTLPVIDQSVACRV
jgi:hypothetical protein